MHLVVQFLFTLASEAENFQKWAYGTKMKYVIYGMAENESTLKICFEQLNFLILFTLRFMNQL